MNTPRAGFSTHPSSQGATSPQPLSDSVDAPTGRNSLSDKVLPAADQASTTPQVRVVPAHELTVTFEARCTHGAKELLQDLRHHPRFSDLVEALEKTDGAILWGDVQDAFVALAHRRPP